MLPTSAALSSARCDQIHIPSHSRRSNPSSSTITSTSQTQQADFYKQQALKQDHSNYHSRSLKMVMPSVNRTSLHPTGVQYAPLPSLKSPLSSIILCQDPSTYARAITDRPLARPSHPHTEIEEELHETAHIDYDRVAIVSLLELEWEARPI